MLEYPCLKHDNPNYSPSSYGLLNLSNARRHNFVHIASFKHWPRWRIVHHLQQPIALNRPDCGAHFYTRRQHYFALQGSNQLACVPMQFTLARLTLISLIALNFLMWMCSFMVLFTSPSMYRGECGRAFEWSQWEHEHEVLVYICGCCYANWNYCQWLAVCVCLFVERSLTSLLHYRVIARLPCEMPTYNSKRQIYTHLCINAHIDPLPLYFSNIVLWRNLGCFYGDGNDNATEFHTMPCFTFFYSN